MSLRMWGASGPIISVEGKKGFFDVSYENDSQAQKLDVWLPEGNGPFPVIVSIHGGGYSACDKRQKGMITPMLSGLSKGYAVIGLNYRLSRETQYPNPVKDIKQAIRFIKANASEWGIDPNRIVIWGGSAGGYMTLMSCLFADDEEFDNPDDPNLLISAHIAGAIAWYPQTDFSSCDKELKMNSVINSFLRKELLDTHEKYVPAFGEVKESDFPYHDADNTPGVLFLGDSTQSETAKKASPIYRLHKSIPPILVQHGSGDEILPMQQSIRFALKANEICGDERVKLEIIPNAIHASVLFETEENIEKCLSFIGQIFSSIND
ncbi:alpha/beta hydrolase [Clostridium sp. CTA-7]